MMSRLLLLAPVAAQAVQLCVYDDAVCDTPLRVPGGLSGCFSLETDKCLSQADGFPVNAYVECGDDNKVRFYSYETVESCEAGDITLTDTISTNVCAIPEEGVSSWQWDCNVAADTPTIYNVVEVTLQMEGITAEQFETNSDIYWPVIRDKFVAMFGVSPADLSWHVNVGGAGLLEAALLQVEDFELGVDVKTDDPTAAQNVANGADQVAEADFVMPEGSGLPAPIVGSVSAGQVSQVDEDGEAALPTNEFSPPEYEVSEAAAFFHSFPRLNGADAVLPDVGEDLMGGDMSEHQDYAIGVGIWAGVYIIFAVVMLIAFFCAGMCQICHCCEKGTDEERALAQAKRLEGPKFWFWRTLYLTVGLLAVGTCFLAYSDDVAMSGLFESVDTSVALVDGWATGVTDSGADLGENVADGYPVVEAVQAALLPTCPDVFSDTVGTIWDGLNSSLDALSSLPEVDTTQLTTMGQTIADGEDTSGLAGFAWLGVGGVAAYMTLVVSLYTCQRKHDDCCAMKSCLVGVTWLLRPVGLVMVFLLFLVAGLILPVGILTGDLCAPNPTDVFISLAGNMSGEIEFVATCNAENSMIAQVEATLLEQFPKIERAVNDFIDTTRDTPECVGIANSPADQALTDFEEHWKLTKGNLLKFAGSASCASINPIYTSLVHDTMCGSVPAALYHFWLMMTVAATSTAYLLWNFHDNTDTVDERAYKALHQDESDLLKEEKAADDNSAASV